MKKSKTKVKSKMFIVLMILLVIVLLIMLMLAKKDGTWINKMVKNIYLQEEEGITVTYGNTAREKLNFNYDWIFSKGEGVNNASSNLPSSDVTVIPESSNIHPYESSYTITAEHVGLNNETWENVSLPHTYNDVDTFDTFTENGYNGDRSTYSGTAWYKKEFYIPQEYSGKKIYIEFEAARQAAKVYLNGTQLTGTYENGFIPFGYDLTPYITFGGTNYITVKVDNTFPYVMEGTTDTVSWHDSHWHPNYGGLYRNSYLYIVDPVHLTLPLYSFIQTEGTYIYTSNELATSAVINIEAEIENSYIQNVNEDSKSVKLVAYVRNMNGVAIQEISGEVTNINIGEKKILTVSGTLTDVIRWSTAYPYLYTIECKLIVDNNGTETVVDNNSTQMGIRTFRFTNDYGFYLNENYEKLQGWGQRPTNEWAGLGAAYSDWMQDYVIKLMKDGGSNFIRWGHCAGSPTQISSSDKYGILVLQPGVDGEGETAGGSYTTNTYRLRTDAFRDMIIYYRNNPSIVMWEIGNQLVPESVSQTIISYVQRYDHGGRTYSSPNQAGDYSYNNTEIKTNTGAYTATTADSTRLAAVRRGIDLTMVDYVDIGLTTEGQSSMNSNTYGNKPAVEGEYNRLEARRGVWDIYTEGYENFTNSINNYGTSAYQNSTSETFAVYQITSYIDMISSIKHCGGANWIFSDSISHGRLNSEVSRASGEVDGVMLPKEAYWVSKVIFSETPSAHIIGHWNYPANTIKNVYVAANCEQGTQATLTVTNSTAGTTQTYTGTKSKTYLWTFENVLFEEGSVSVEVKNGSGTVLASDSITTHGEPASLRLTPIIGPNGLLANGSDVLLVDVEVLDSNNNRCITFDGVRDNIYTYFTVNSQASNVNTDAYCTWKGGYNSGIQYSINKKYLYIESGITRVALRTAMQEGPISVTANMTLANGTTLTDTCSINSTSVDNTNGYSAMLNPRSTYNISGLTNPGIGNGALPGGTEEAEIISYTSSLIENLSYSGNTSSLWGLQEVLENGAMAYTDLNVTFESIPYKYLNAEYLKLPNADNGALAIDLINFSSNKNIDILVFRDSNVENPSWLSSYTLTDDIVTTSDGKIYRIYKKSVTVGTGITIGGNGDTSAIGASGRMNIIAFKETAKINNATFFNENFESAGGAPTMNGWHSIIGADTAIIAELGDTVPAIHLKDSSDANAGSNLAYMYKSFATLTGKYKLKYELYVSSTLNSSPITNNWIRLFLHNGPALSDITAKTNVITETYMHANTTLMYRIKISNNNMNIKTGIATDTWHEFEFDINSGTKTFTTKVDNISTGNTASFYGGSYDAANCFIVGTGGSSLNDFHIRNVEVVPYISTAITGINVNGVPIAEFNPLTKAYLAKSAPGAAVELTTVLRDANVSSTITYNNNRADIVVTDSTDNSTLNYTVYINNEYINKTQLRSILSYVNGLNPDWFTDTTWNNVLVEATTAQLVLTSEETTQAQLQNELIRLKDKIKALKIDRQSVLENCYN